MKIEKLPSGSYRIRKMYKGKQYTVVVDYKPTQKQALELISEAMDSGSINRNNMTFSEAYIDYLSLKSHILSPSTKRGYKSCFNALTDTFRNKNINDIDSVDVQKEINDYSVNHSPKSCSNLYGLIYIILKTYRENIKLNVKLPQKVKIEPYIPTPEEVKAIMDELNGTPYYIPVALASLGMRRSEICAATLEDLTDDNMLRINKALVQDENNKYVMKTTKTTYSTREIFIPSEIADKIRAQGYIYNGNAHMIYKKLVSVQDKLGIQHFSLHKMRHFFASYAHDMGWSDSIIMNAGGWKSDVMKNVYRHPIKEDEAKKQIASQIGGLF